MRVTHSVHTKKRHKKVLARAKGFRGGRSRLYSVAKHAIIKAMAFEWRDRKLRKRNFRSLWIQRLGAAVRPHGLSYSRFVHLLTKANVALDRKALSELAIHDPKTFAAITAAVKAAA